MVSSGPQGFATAFMANAEHFTLIGALVRTYNAVTLAIMGISPIACL